MGPGDLARAIVLDFDPSPDDVEVYEQRLRLMREGRSGMANNTPVEPLLILTPLGWPDRDGLERVLNRKGIRVSSRAPLENWPALATLLYHHRPGSFEMARAMAFEALWHLDFDGRAGAVWYLSEPEGFQRLLSCKAELRQRFVSRAYEVSLPGGRFRANLHAFHVPDLDRLTRECGWIARGRPLERSLFLSRS